MTDVAKINLFGASAYGTGFKPVATPSEEPAKKGAGAFGAGFPTEITPVTGSPKVGGVEGVQGVNPSGSEFAEIASRGMRVNDTEMGVNQPMATTPQKQLGRTGVVGAQFRMNM